MFRPIVLAMLISALTSAVNSEISANGVDNDNSYQNNQNQISNYQYPFPYTFDSMNGQPTGNVQDQGSEHETSRDSYVAAASDAGYKGGGGGYSQKGYGSPSPSYGSPSYGPPKASYGPSTSYGGYGGSSSSDKGGFDLGGSGSIGLLGLLGLKGLKALVAPLFLPAIAPILLPILPIILLVLSPILLILFLPILLILGLPLLILFLPVPLVTSFRSLPGQQRINLVESILYRDECMERLSCEVSRLVNATGFSAPWMKKLIPKVSKKPTWMNRISRAAQSTDCKEYTCGMVKSIQESFNAIGRPD